MIFDSRSINAGDSYQVTVTAPGLAEYLRFQNISPFLVTYYFDNNQAEAQYLIPGECVENERPRIAQMPSVRNAWKGQIFIAVAMPMGGSVPVNPVSAQLLIEGFAERHESRRHAVAQNVNVGNVVGVNPVKVASCKGLSCSVGASSLIVYQLPDGSNDALFRISGSIEAKTNNHRSVSLQYVNNDLPGSVPTGETLIGFNQGLLPLVQLDGSSLTAIGSWRVEPIIIHVKAVSGSTISLSLTLNDATATPDKANFTLEQLTF